MSPLPCRNAMTPGARFQRHGSLVRRHSLLRVAHSSSNAPGGERLRAGTSTMSTGFRLARPGGTAAARRALTCRSGSAILDGSDLRQSVGCCARRVAVPQAIDQLFRMLDELAAIPSENEQEMYVYLHPLLLEPGSAEALEASIGDGAEDGQSAARAAAVAYVREIRGLWKESEGYPVGVGPIETLWLKVNNRELSLSAATERLTAPDSLVALTPRYLRAICGWGASQALDGAWRAAVPILRLALAAVDALPPEPGSEELRAFAATT